MDILQVLKTIQEDWIILLFFFGLGGAWIQGKMWFHRVDKTIREANSQHAEQNRILTSLKSDIGHLKDKVNDIEYTVKSIHEEVHVQEIKLAVLENKNKR
jgi:septal ring factor EnvC (AmiA/AmiB activator)